MRSLIIGGSRFMGKHLVGKLSELNHKITVINRGTRKIKYPQNCEHIKVDRTNYSELKNSLNDMEFDWVFDFYAMKGKETKEIIKILDGRVKRFIHISTIRVYDLEKKEKFSTHTIFEDDPIGEISDDEFWYSREKRLSEKFLFEAFKSENFPMTIIRPTIVYGPDNHIYRESYFFDRIKYSHPLFIPKCSAYFDLVYVDDVVDLCILAAKKGIAIGKSYNATGGEIVTAKKLATLIGNIIGNKPIIKYFTEEDLKAINYPKEKELFPYPKSGFNFFSNQKSVLELGFNPIRLKEGMKLTYKWYEKQKFQQPDLTFEKLLLKNNMKSE